MCTIRLCIFFSTLDDTACTTECFLLTKFPGVLVVETEPLVSPIADALFLLRIQHETIPRYKLRHRWNSPSFPSLGISKQVTKLAMFHSLHENKKTPETLKSKGYNWAINCWDSMLLPSQKGCVCFVFFFQGPLNFTNARSWRLHWKATRRGQLRTHTLRVSVKTKCHYCHYKKGYGWWLTVKIQGCSW